MRRYRKIISLMLTAATLPVALPCASPLALYATLQSASPALAVANQKVIPAIFRPPPERITTAVKPMTAYARAHARPNISINYCEGLAHVSYPGSGNASDSFRGYLATIDQTAVKNLVPEQINNLLEGELGSEISISYVNINCEEHQVILTRSGVLRHNDIEVDRARGLYLNQEDAATSVWTGGVRDHLNFRATQNLDLHARADVYLEQWRYLNQPMPNKKGAFASAVRCLEASAMAGDLSGIEKSIDLMRKNANFTLHNPNDQRASGQEALELLQNLDLDRNKEVSTSIANKWVEHAKMGLQISTPNSIAKSEYGQAEHERIRLQLGSSDPDYGLTPFSANKIQKIANCAEIVEQLKQLEKNYVENTASSARSKVSFWLANAYEVAGRPDLALALYRKLDSLDSIDSYNARAALTEMQIQGYRLFRLSQLQKTTGDNQNATATMEKLANIYSRRFTSDQLASLEKLKGFFPAMSDVQKELAQLFKIQGKVDSSQNALANARMLSVNSSIETQNPDLLLRSGQKLALYRDTLTSIARGDIKQSRANISRLRKIYQESTVVLHYKFRPFNLFSGLQNIARTLADKGRYEESQSLLAMLRCAAVEREQTPVAADYIDVDTAIHRAMQGKPDWKAVDECCTLVPTPVELKLPDASRSMVALTKEQRLLMIMQNMRHLASLYSLAGYHERARLLINRAMKLAYENALALERATSPDLRAEREISVLEASVVAARSGDLASGIRLADRSDTLTKITSARRTIKSPDLESARKYLKLQLIEILEHNGKWSEAMRLSHIAVKSLSSSEVTPFNLHLANCLRAMQRYAEAKKYFELATSNASGKASLAHNILGTNIAEKLSDDGMSALFFHRAADTYQMWYGIDGEIGQKLWLLQKALVYAQKSKPTNTPALLELYLKIAQTLETDGNDLDQEDLLANLEKASRLVSDSLPQKLDILRRIARLRGLNARAKKKANSSLVADLIRAAKNADATGDKDANRDWLELAKEEAKAQLFDAAIQHAYRSIDSFKVVTGDGSKMYPSFPLQAHDDLIRELCNAGRMKDAETILERSEERLIETGGKNSPSHASFLAGKMSWQINSNNEVAAFDTLDRILAMGCRIIELGEFASALEKIEKRNRALAEAGRADLALQINLKILNAQKKTFQADDSRIAETLKHIANIYTRLGDETRASQYRSDANSIHCLYSDQLIRAEIPQNPELALNLRYYKLESQELDHLKTLYAKVRQKAPYCDYAMMINRRLLESARYANDWSSMLQLCSDHVEAATRRLDRSAGRGPDYKILQFNRIDFYILAVQACLALEKSEEAARWYRRALEDLVLPTSHERLQIAKMAKDTGDLDGARKLEEEVLKVRVEQ